MADGKKARKKQDRLSELKTEYKLLGMKIKTLEWGSDPDKVNYEALIKRTKNANG